MACVIDSGGENSIIAVTGFPYIKQCYFVGFG